MEAERVRELAQGHLAMGSSVQSISREKRPSLPLESRDGQLTLPGKGLSCSHEPCFLCPGLGQSEKELWAGALGRVPVQPLPPFQRSPAQGQQAVLPVHGQPGWATEEWEVMGVDWT